MDVNTRNRTELKSYFVKNSIPTEGNFAELIEGMLNQKDDGLVKLPDNPLSIEAAGDEGGTKSTINFYRNFGDSKPDWTLNLNPRSQPNNASTARLGFGISDGEGNNRLFIDRNTGNVGIGTTDPTTAKLEVIGSIKATANASGQGEILMEAPADGKHRITPDASAEDAYKTGLVYRVKQNPASGAPIFQVRSSGQAVRLFVDHDGWTGSRDNSAWFGGSRENYFAGKVGIGITDPGSSKLKVANSDTDFADIRFAAAGGQLEFVAWQQGWNINAKTDGKHLYINRDAGQNSNVLIGRSGKELFVRGSDGSVGIGTTEPRTAFDTRTAVMSGAANDYMKAQFTMSGGGTVTWGGPGQRLKWTQRFIAISMGKPVSFASGYVDIDPLTSDIAAENVYDGKVRSANADGVILNGWEALYAVHTVAGNNKAVSFQIVRYTSNFNAPSNWLLVAVVNDDDDTVRLGTGVVLGANSSSTNSSPIPRGVIMMWSGEANAIPSGWALCDGKNGTRDLRNRFIVAAGTTYEVGNTGGSDTVTLTADQMPSHNHNNGDYQYLLQRLSDGRYTSKETDTTVGEPDLLHSGSIQSAGGNKAHENRPPYYALAFIMKL